MKIGLNHSMPRALALALFAAASAFANNCSEISNDVRVAVEKDPSKVLMVVEDALVINEACAGDIVKSAIVASKADSTLAGQIVQTATSVSPKMAPVIADAAKSVSPGLVVAAAAPAVTTAPAVLPTYDVPVTTSEKNPVAVYGKNPKNPKAPVNIAPEPPPEPDFYIPSTIRG
ncbi:MAG: hypothetical protein RLZZ476_1917, partial [Verrucomicrobiota bacterium]